MNLSPANKNLLTILKRQNCYNNYEIIASKTNYHHINGIFLNGVLRPKILNTPLATCFLINLHFLVPFSTHFDNNIVLLLLVFETLGFMFSVIFYT